MTRITIPRTADDASVVLADLGAIATATEWKRAAIVAAFVDPDRNGQRRELATSGQLESARAFAERGIVGLTSKATVLRYATAWLDRYPRPVPGSRIDMPTIPWNDPDDAESPGPRKSKVHDIVTNPTAMRAAMAERPDLVADAVAEDPRIAKAIGSRPAAAWAVATADPANPAKAVAPRFDDHPEAREAGLSDLVIAAGRAHTRARGGIAEIRGLALGTTHRGWLPADATEQEAVVAMLTDIADRATAAIAAITVTPEDALR